MLFRSVVAVASTFPAQSLRELVDLVRSQPGKHAFSSTGIGSVFHLAGESLNRAAGIDMLHVPYKGGAPVMTALLAGELTSIFAPGTLAAPLVKAGKLRALGNMGSVRTSMMPDLPNIGETIPGYALDSWMGVMGPAGMPRAVVDRLNTEFNRFIRDPAFGREKLTPNGIDPLGTTPERMQEQLAADIDKYARIAQSAGIKPE